jgi:predicted phage terminase large subunit-like protein
MKDFTTRNGYTNSSRVRVEPKASGMPAAQTLRRYAGMNMLLDKPPTADKVTRAKSVSAFVESGRVYVLRDSAWADDFLGQCAGFPNMKHDEDVDLLVIAISNIEVNKGNVMSFGSV